jgi:hypothetical protein
MIVFSFFLLFRLALDVKQDTSTQSITLATPHLLAWSVIFDVPIKICAEYAASPFSMRSTLHTTSFPSGTF